MKLFAKGVLWAVLAALSLTLSSCGGGGASSTNTTSSANYSSITPIGTSSLDNKGMQGYQTPSTANSISFIPLTKGTTPLTAMYVFTSLSKYAAPEPSFSVAANKATIVASMIETGFYTNGNPYSLPHLRATFDGSITETVDLAGHYNTTFEENNYWTGFCANGKYIILAFADKRVSGTTLSPGAGLSYTQFGAWDVAPYASAGMSYSQVFVGMGTPTAAMPSGVYSYSGAVVGYVVDSSGAKHLIEGDVTLTFDSSASTVDASLANMVTKLPAANLVQGSFNDLSFTGSVTGNGFSALAVTVSPMSGSVTPTSTASMTPGTTSASMSGHFYGPTANELSLSFQLSGNGGTGGTVKLIAALAAKQ
ncbi:MAG: transferrin-binding protein-like solute binding protein [Gammaproteobacteria bacterium]|nr:transferrin-binding protein-like solute binding protein [Gammaproteobacteria bacterium]MBU1482685.1 transferrin-binding protein-like solute binding protein [Gammaproteobacteria bacterium]